MAKVTKEDFMRLFKLSGKYNTCGTFLIESEYKIYKFTIGADGSIWDCSNGAEKSNCNEIIEARCNPNFLGGYEVNQII